jgi:hypothetical protein
MKFEARLKQIEQKLRPKEKKFESKLTYLDLFDIPREEMEETFAVLGDAGGYHLMFTNEEQAALGDEQINALNQLTPSQFYEVMFADRLKQREQQQNINGRN